MKSGFGWLHWDADDRFSFSVPDNVLSRAKVSLAKRLFDYSSHTLDHNLVIILVTEPTLTLTLFLGNVKERSEDEVSSFSSQPDTVP